MDPNEDVLGTIEKVCGMVVSSPNPAATAAQLQAQGFSFIQPGQPHHDYYRWRVGELRARENAGRAQPSEEMLAAVETAAKRISESNAPEAEQQQLLSSGSSPFIDASHPLHDFFKWRLTLASAPPPPKKTGHVTFALNHRAPGNTPLSMGQLFTMLAPLLESKNSKPGIFIDPNGHVVIPAGVFDPPSEN